MKQYFIVADVHSYYTPLMTGLKKAGFDRDNELHVIVIAGDLFDRGDESREVYEFVRSLPKDRLVYIKGNHEELLDELTCKMSPELHDYHNGTVKTLYDLTGYNTFKKAKEKLKEMRVIEWINRVTVDYFEIGDYIITHAMIPCKTNYPHFVGKEFRVDLKVNKSWRTKADYKDWYNARWVNPYTYISSGFFNLEKEKGKTLVFGHWFACKIKAEDQRLDFSNNDKVREYIKKTRNHKNYFGDHFIAIDNCVMTSGIIDVLVINEEGVMVK